MINENYAVRDIIADLENSLKETGKGHWIDAARSANIAVAKLITCIWRDHEKDHCCEHHQDNCMKFCEDNNDYKLINVPIGNKVINPHTNDVWQVIVHEPETHRVGMVKLNEDHSWWSAKDDLGVEFNNSNGTWIIRTR